MLLPEVRGEWVYITSTVPWINEQNGRVVPWHTSRRETGKNRGVDLAKGYHSGAHAVVAVSRGGEDTQGEGGIVLAFFGPLKQFVEINSNVGKMLRGDFTVPLGGYLVTDLF